MRRSTRSKHLRCALSARRGAAGGAGLRRPQRASARDDMDADFYESRPTLATSSSNLAQIQLDAPEHPPRRTWSTSCATTATRTSPVLGHRQLAAQSVDGRATGFGLANSESGMSYVLMYAHDIGNAGAQWSRRCCWPAEGAFPVELMHANLAWSVYAECRGIRPRRIRTFVVTLPRRNRVGLSLFNLTAPRERATASAPSATTGYGAGAVRDLPAGLLPGRTFTDYEQNQRWTVRVERARDRQSGETASLVVYDVEMVSLSRRRKRSQRWKSAPLEAQPVTAGRDGFSMDGARWSPQYADDLSVCVEQSRMRAWPRWTGTGLVTAVAPGNMRNHRASPPTAARIAAG